MTKTYRTVQSTKQNYRYDLKFSSLPWTPLCTCHDDNNNAYNAA